MGKKRNYPRRRPEFYKYYSVYNRKTDAPVYIHGTSVECAAAMGITRSTFLCYVTRNRQGKQCKYDIYIDEEDEGDE